MSCDCEFVVASTYRLGGPCQVAARRLRGLGADRGIRTMDMG
jgi:hypothetical protein